MALGQAEKFNRRIELMRCQPEKIPAHLFRAYDIRGIVTDELVPEVVHDIGVAIGSYLREIGGDKNIIVGRDGRLSGPVLIQALKEGLKTAGVNVIDIGMVPTPVLYFATKFLGVNSGVMLTGSHNPPNYNGLKMVLDGKTIAGEEIQKIYQLLKNQVCFEAEKQGESNGTERAEKILDAYQNRILQEISLSKFKNKKLKVVVDCGNGVTGLLAPMLIQKLGCEVIGLFTEVDGNFPNHHPDPSKAKNLEELQRAVLNNNADIGLAFDGDGDRLGVVTSKGKIIWPDRQVMLYAKDVLSRFPGSVILYDVKCTRHLAEIIASAGGEPVMCPTGHSLVKKEIVRTGAKLAGEMSGHIFFNDTWYGFDDGIYTAARLLRIISESELSSDALFASLPEACNTPEINIAVPEHEKFGLIQKIVRAALEGRFPEAKIITLDGLRVEFPHGFALIRVSNTSPCFVLRFESNDVLGLQEIQSRFRNFLLECAPHIDWNFEGQGLGHV